jgi:uncharacterized membrane protein HdeD (DUF308 family)
MSKTLVAALPDQAVNELWWLTMVESTFALFFGISAVFWPGLTLVTLVYLFSGFVLGLGILQLFSGIMSIRARSTWWITMLIGIAGIGIGIYLVRHPDISFRSFVLLVGLLLLARGLLDLVRVFTDRQTTRGGVPKVLLAIMGVAAIIAGVFIMVQPVVGGVAFVWILGLYAIVFGALNMAIAIELRMALLEQSAESLAEPEPRTNNDDRTDRKKSGVQPA